MSMLRWAAPTSCALPSPSTTYLRTGAPFGAAGPQVTRAVALPADAVTLDGGPGGPTVGFCGGGGGGVGGGSPPSTWLAYLSTTLNRPWSSTTGAVAEVGAVVEG